MQAMRFTPPPPPPSTCPLPAGTRITYPAVLETEFKRPTFLPAKLHAVTKPTAHPALQIGVLTADGEKEVMVGRLYRA